MDTRIHGKGKYRFCKWVMNIGFGNRRDQARVQILGRTTGIGGEGHFRGKAVI